MKTKLLLFVLMVLPFFVTACSKDDGDWEPMKWRSEVKKASDGYIHVPPEGGTFVFYCKNYSSFWINQVTEAEPNTEEKRFLPACDDHEDLTITSNWLTATREGAMLTVAIRPTAADGNRVMTVYVLSGDVAYQFSFKQRGLKVGL